MKTVSDMQIKRSVTVQDVAVGIFICAGMILLIYGASLVGLG